MNGIHDMGGMDGMGAIDPGAQEQPFAAPWQAQAFAHLLATGALGRWNNDAVRSRFENFPALDYLRMDYFERWHAGLVRLLLETGLITGAELASRRADPAATAPPALLRAEGVQAMLAAGEPYERAAPGPPRFAPGDGVHTRNPHPTGHTRLPRYARDKPGKVDRWHGTFVFPDTNALFLGEHPQHLYSVRFSASDLWGERGAATSVVYLDIWESHLAAR